jgi:bifunctional DNA-binding transcriptional regulator/antitoxin component of YhaV-PrlF toxin-antitoxin module
MCESRTTSATAVRKKRQTTLPAEVCEPAGIEVGDQIDWRFEGGEIRGRKLIPEVEKTATVRPVFYQGFWMMPGQVDTESRFSAGSRGCAHS